MVGQAMIDAKRELESRMDHLAWRLLTEPTTVKLEAVGLEQDDLAGQFHLKDGNLAIVDPQEGRERAIRYIQVTYILPFVERPSDLFGQLQQAYIWSGLARGDNLPGHALARLHNAGTIDAIELALSSRSVWGDDGSVARVLGDALPLFEDVSVSRLLEAVEQFAGGGLSYLSLSQLLGARTGLVPLVVEGCLERTSQSLATLLRVALIQGAAVDRAEWIDRIHSLVDSADPLVARASLEALGHLQWASAPVAEVDAAGLVIRRWLRSQRDEADHRTAVMAALNLATSAPGCHGLIDEVAKLEVPYVTRYIGDHLAFTVDNLSAEPWYFQKFDLLAEKRGQEPGGFGGVDHALAQRYGIDKAACLSWLDRWVQVNLPDPASLSIDLPRLLAAIIADTEQLGELLAHWLMHERVSVQRVGAALLDHLGNMDVTGLAYPPKFLSEMGDSALSHLAKRTIAHTWRDDQRLSLVWSMTMMSDAPDRIFGLVEELMVEVVGYDFPEITLKHLEAVSQCEGKSPLGDLARRILSKLAQYYDSLDALDVAEELSPPSEERRLFAKERARKAEQAAEEANKNSIMSRIATTVPVKAGRSTFSVQEGRVGPASDMISISHSMAIARREILDKVGNDLIRRVIITSKVDAE